MLALGLTVLLLDLLSARVVTRSGHALSRHAARCRPRPASACRRSPARRRPCHVGHSHRGAAAPAHPGLPRRRDLRTAGGRSSCVLAAVDRRAWARPRWAATWTPRWRPAGCSGAGWPFSAACWAAWSASVRRRRLGGSSFQPRRAAGRPRGRRAAAPAGHARRRPRRRLRRAGQRRAAARRRGRRSPLPATGRPRRLRPRPCRATRPPGRRPGAVVGPGPGRPRPDRLAARPGVAHRQRRARRDAGRGRGEAAAGCRAAGPDGRPDRCGGAGAVPRRRLRRRGPPHGRSSWPRRTAPTSTCP